MEQRIYKFLTNIDGDMESFTTCPIYDDNMVVVGGFCVYSGNAVEGFISGNENSVALLISTGDGFWFTPKSDSTGRIHHAIVSEVQHSVLSKLVRAVEVL